MNNKKIFSYIQSHLHIPDLTLPSLYTVSEALNISYDEVLEEYSNLAIRGLIVQDSEYLYSASVWFPITETIKDKIRQYELKQTTPNRII